MVEILHITSQSAWAAAQGEGEHRDPSLETEGFIHCSAPTQVLGPANALFAGRDDLLLLRIDPELLTHQLVYEDSYGHGTFPHIYGPINLDAVTGTTLFPPNADGTFSLPASLQHVARSEDLEEDR